MNLIHHLASIFAFLDSLLVLDQHLVIRVVTVKSKQVVLVAFFKLQFSLNHIKSQTHSHIEHILLEFICSEQGQFAIFWCCLQLLDQLRRADKCPIDEKTALAI